MNKTSAAQQAKVENSLSPTRGLLQRKCSCGNKTVASGECAECGKKKINLQRKLTIGASNDPLEREADRVADQVMAMSLNSGVNTTLPHIQRFSGKASDGLTTTPDSVGRVLASPGRPLEPAVRQDMESRFGHDFSQVRVHTDHVAEQSAQDVNAHAYTVGSNMVFGEGRFAPNSSAGKRLIAHELTHVVQQSGSEMMFIDNAGLYSNSSRLANIAQQRTEGLSTTTTLQRKADDFGLEPETPAKLHLFVDIDVEDLGFSDLKNADVGHTWISIEYKDPKNVPTTTHPKHKPYLQGGGKYSDPMGFWPAVNEGIGFSLNPFSSWVKGWMRHPDQAHRGAEKASQTWDIDESAVGRVINYAESKRNALYSVYFFNCTTFAVEAIEASGKNPPSISSYGFAMPNGAYEGIKSMQRMGLGQTSVKDFDTGNETIVDALDTPIKRG